jgi:hypothetical protein
VNNSQTRAKAALGAAKALFAVMGDASASSIKNAADIQEAFDRFKERNGQSRKRMAEEIGFDEGSLKYFEEAIKSLVRWNQIPDPDEHDQRQLHIASLRLLLWIREIGERKSGLHVDVENELPTQSEEQITYNRVRAIELLYRGVITDSFGSQQKLLDFFSETFTKKEVDAVRRTSQRDNAASGTTFGQLIQVIERSRIYDDKLDKLYDSTPYLRYLKAREATFLSFLHDVKSVRNQAAHHKSLSKLHYELLSLYYEELTDPLEKAFAAGSFSRRPSDYLSQNPEDLTAFRAKLVEELKPEKTQKKLSLIVGLSAASLVGIVLVFLVLYRLLNPSDPRQQLQHEGIDWTDTALHAAIRNDDRRVVELFLKGGMQIDKYTVGLTDGLNPFDAEMANIVVKYSHGRLTECPEDWDDIAKDPRKLKFINSMCDYSQFRKWWQERLDSLNKEASDTAKNNELSESNIKDCNDRLLAKSTNDLVYEARTDRLDAPVALGVHTFDSQHYATVITRPDIEKIVREGCAEEFRVKPIPTAERDMVKSLLDNFGN